MSPVSWEDPASLQGSRSEQGRGSEVLLDGKHTLRAGLEGKGQKADTLVMGQLGNNPALLETGGIPGQD